MPCKTISFSVNKFSNRLKGLRKEQKLNQKDVAEAVYIAQPTYSGYESGRQLPNTETLFFLAAFFSVSADYLIGLSNKKGL